MIAMKRAYDRPAPDDGHRVLVDRLWPRGLRKEEASIDAWEKDLAPSPELRKWFAHDPERWEKFRRRYREELRAPAARAKAAELARRGERERVTLVYAAKDPDRNNAAVLLEALGGGRR